MVLNEDELCGEPTSSGKPCNMPKGHNAPFHRSREYNKPVNWIIKNTVNKELESGIGRKELGYAMTRWLKSGISIVIEVKP